MAEQVVNFRLKATNDASAELVKVADEMRRLNHEAVTSRAGVTQWGNAWGTASKSAGDGAKAAAGGLDALNTAAKGVASGGFQQMLSTIPGIGGALAQLANQLGPTTLLLGGFAAAGVGVLKFLQGLSKDADEALAKVTALSEGIAAATRQTALEVQKIRADAAGNQAAAREAEAQKELDAIETAKKKRIDAAKAELDTLDLFGRQRTELSQAARNEILAAEADAALKTLVINEKKTADLKKLDDERLADEKKNRDEAVKKEEEAAKQIIADTKASTSSVAAIFKDLGAGFENTAKRLGLNEFVQKQKDAMAELEKGLKLGTVTLQQYDEGTAALTKRMQDAITLGYVPTVEAAKKVTEAVTVATEATKTAGESIAASLFKAGAASEGLIATLDALIAKGAAAQAAFAGAGRSGPVPVGFTGGAGSAVRPAAGGASGGGGGGGATGVYGLDFTTLGGIANQPKGSGLTPMTGGASQYYDLGAISHPSIRDAGPGQNLNPNPASAAGYRDRPTVQTVNLTVNQTGTVVSNDRDWATVGASVAAGSWNAY
jgi:hypothetical protein